MNCTSYKIGRVLLIAGASLGLTGFILLFTDLLVLGLVFIAFASILAPSGIKFMQSAIEYEERVQPLLREKRRIEEEIKKLEDELAIQEEIKRLEDELATQEAELAAQEAELAAQEAATKEATTDEDGHL